LFEPTTIDLVVQFLPFLIIFTVFYTMLMKSQVLGSSKSTTIKRINILFALIVAIILVFVNPLSIPWVTIFGQIFAGATIIIILLAFLVFIAIMLGAARQERTVQGLPKTGILGFVIAIILALIILSVSGVIPSFFPETMGNLDLSQITPFMLIFVIIFVIIGIFYLFSKAETTEHH